MAHPPSVRPPSVRPPSVRTQPARTQPTRHPARARAGALAQSTTFLSNRSQAVRLPRDVVFPEDVKTVVIRARGKARIVTPLDALWEDFFADPACPDFPDCDQPFVPRATRLV